MAFRASDLPFYSMHAKLWFLIALARISVEKPEVATFFEDILEANLSEQHVLFCHFAKIALKNIVAHGLPTKSDVTRLNTLNTAKSVNPKTPGDHRRNSYGSRPEGEIKAANRFSFEYDFEKHELDGLGRVFGVDTYRVGDDVSLQVHEWESGIESMYDCPRRGEQDYYPDETASQIDGYGKYLAYHGLMTVAGKYLATKPAIEDYDERNPWDDWLSNHTLSRNDGLWFADGTDLSPTTRTELEDMKLDETGSSISVLERKRLAQLIGISDQGDLPEEVFVYGYWDAAEQINIQLSSALVANKETRVVAFSLVTGDTFFQHLPSEDDHFYGLRDVSLNPVTPWIQSNRHEDLSFDELDPYACSFALRRPAPGEKIIVSLNLSQADPFRRSWLKQCGSTMFCAEAWGTKHGLGRHVREVNGERLRCVKSDLLALLRTKKCDLIVLIKAQKYLEHASRGNKFVTKSAVIIVSSNGKARIIHRIPKNIRAAVLKLDQHDRTEFEARLAAVRAELNR